MQLKLKLNLFKGEKINWLKLQTPFNKAEISKFLKNHFCTPSFYLYTPLFLNGSHKHLLCTPKYVYSHSSYHLNPTHSDHAMWQFPTFKSRQSYTAMSSSSPSHTWNPNPNFSHHDQPSRQRRSSTVSHLNTVHLAVSMAAPSSSPSPRECNASTSPMAATTMLRSTTSALRNIKTASNTSMAAP